MPSEQLNRKSWCNVGKLPDVSQANGGTGGSQYKPGSGTPVTSIRQKSNLECETAQDNTGASQRDSSELVAQQHRGPGAAWRASPFGTANRSRERESGRCPGHSSRHSRGSLIVSWSRSSLFFFRLFGAQDPNRRRGQMHDTGYCQVGLEVCQVLQVSRLARQANPEGERQAYC